MNVEEHNSKVLALNIKESIVYRNLVSKREIRQYEILIDDIEKRLKSEASKRTGDDLIQSLESNINYLKVQRGYLSMWEDSRIITDGMIMQYGLYNDPEVNSKYVLELSEGY